MRKGIRQNYCVVIDYKDGRNWEWCSTLLEAIGKGRQAVKDDNVKRAHLTINFWKENKQ